MLRDLAKRVVNRVLGRVDIPPPWDAARWERYFKKRSFQDFNNHTHYNPLAHDQEVYWPLPPKTPLLQFVEGVFEEDLPLPPLAADALYCKLMHELWFTHDEAMRVVMRRKS